jgi:hypothetical protein
MPDQPPTWMIGPCPLAALLDPDPNLARAVVSLHTTQGVPRPFFPWTRVRSTYRYNASDDGLVTASQVPNNMAMGQAARLLASTSYRGGICLTPWLDRNQTTAPWSPGQTCLWSRFLRPSTPGYCAKRQCCGGGCEARQVAKMTSQPTSAAPARRLPGIEG